MPHEPGRLIISLDFELYWGVRDKRTIESYMENLLGVRVAIPFLLDLFDEYNIHATWSTVGFLFFSSRNSLLKSLPMKKPDYLDSNLSPYLYIRDHEMGMNETEDPFHFAPSLIKKIASYPHQRIGTHTFSHYYCLEKGQDISAFREDLQAAIGVAKQCDLNLQSLIFPRNQFNPEYVSVCEEMGIRSYRGNEDSWMYRAGEQHENFPLRRVFRLIDAYWNFSGHHCYSMETIQRSVPFNIPSSRFLRPYTKTLKMWEPLRLRRICSGLTHAAKHGLVYHLWWHPHNFGANILENLSFLRKILDHYSMMHKRYGMVSMNMEELSNTLIQIKKQKVI